MSRFRRIAKDAGRFLLSTLGRDVFYTTQAKRNKEHHGSDYGGYEICPDNLDSKSIVYSFGLGDDISFDLSIISKYHCTVYAYDPSPETKVWIQTQQTPPSFVYHDIGIGTSDGILRFFPSPNQRINYSLIERPVLKGKMVEVPVERLETIARRNNHTRINLLKIDIEGAEFDVLPDILATDIAIDQIVLEFHHKHKEFAGKGIAKIKKAVESLNAHGFRIFSIANENEFSFIR